MPALFLELFSEEIPARMQARAAEDLARLLAEALAALTPSGLRRFHGPRRIALAAEVAAGVAGASGVERGPRASAPEQALAGFLRKHGAAREQLRVEGEYWVLDKSSAAVGAAALIAGAIPPLLRRFPWPKSMRWGGTSQFTWVRPLRRIVCLLGGEVVRFDLREGEDDGHGLASGDLTEGHRFMTPGAVAVASRADWEETLRARFVLVDAAERRRVVADGLAALAAAEGLAVAPDPGLLDEVAGLVEWPVPLLGRIDDAYMDLPPEVMQVSMRVNQRYFALRTEAGGAAPFFGFAAGIAPEDGGAAIVAGNERVLRARFADARHFWDLDRRTRLADRVPALDAVTFHARLGSQRARVRRLERLAGVVAGSIDPDPELARQATKAARLAKADLVTGMVGEFPELQGVMGRYYALHDGEPPEVADAIRDHYAPKGPSDAVPTAPVSIATGLADKLDLLAAFFAIGERPTGSGDPYALRRAALGVIRILRENAIRLHLRPLIETAGLELTRQGLEPAPPDQILAFLAERLVVQLRTEGDRHDVLQAVFAAGALNALQTDDLVDLLARKDAIAATLQTPEGADLLTAYRRAANILAAEMKKDGPASGEIDPALLQLAEERHLWEVARDLAANLDPLIEHRSYDQAMRFLAAFRKPLDAFFDKVTVNAPEPELRQNRLRLLSSVRSTMDRVADFSKIEG